MWVLLPPLVNTWSSDMLTPAVPIVLPLLKNIPFYYLFCFRFVHFLLCSLPAEAPPCGHSAPWGPGVWGTFCLGSTGSSRWFNSVYSMQRRRAGYITNVLHSVVVKHDNMYVCFRKKVTTRCARVAACLISRETALCRVQFQKCTLTHLSWGWGEGAAEHVTQLTACVCPFHSFHRDFSSMQEHMITEWTLLQCNMQLITQESNRELSVCSCKLYNLFVLTSGWSTKIGFKQTESW